MKKPSTDHPTIFYGWFAILGGMIASLAHGVTISVGNYTMAAMVTSAGLSPTIPGYCGSILNLCSVLFTAPLCTLITRKGHRFALLLGEGCALIAFALLTRWGANDIVLLLCYLPVGFGLVTGCKVGSPHLVSAWFQERNSLPMTLTIGIASLSAIFSGFNAENIARCGWQAEWVFLGALCVIAALAEWLLVRDDPAAVGEVVDGKRWRAQHGYPLTPASRLDGTAADVQSSHSTRTLLRDWKFLLFNTGAFFRMGTYSGCVTYVSLLIMSKGYQQTQSVAAVTLLTLASMCGCFSVPLWERCKVSEFQQNILSNGMMAVGCFLVFAGTDSETARPSSGFRWLWLRLRARLPDLGIDRAVPLLRLYGVLSGSYVHRQPQLCLSHALRPHRHGLRQLSNADPPTFSVQPPICICLPVLPSRARDRKERLSSQRPPLKRKNRERN